MDFFVVVLIAFCVVCLHIMLCFYNVVVTVSSLLQSILCRLLFFLWFQQTPLPR